jgi:hypothetical protein
MTTTEIGILWAVGIVYLLLGRMGARMDARQDRADLARLRAELAAITKHTLARTRARSDASRRGWATRQKAGTPPSMDEGDMAAGLCGNAPRQLHGSGDNLQAEVRQ